MTRTDSRNGGARGVEPRDAVADALLAEALGDARHRDQTDAVLARLAAGDAEAAATRAELAARPDGPEDARRSRLERLRPWLVAALLLLGIGVVVGIAVSDPDAVDDFAQEPDAGTDDVVPIRDVGHLRELLPHVKTVELEVLRLPDPDVPFDVELAGVPVIATDGIRERIVRGLAGAGLQVPAGWDWQNRLTLSLDDGHRVAMALYPYDPGTRQTIGVRGLKGDLTVSGDAAAACRELLDAATTVARMAHGVVLRADELAGPGAFPANLEELRLFGIADADLRHLQRFEQLKRLDVAGLRDTLGREGLREIGRCFTLEELSLDGCAVDDEGIAPIFNLNGLQRLGLRGVRSLTGTGFRHFGPMSFYRKAPTSVDLRDVPTLTDDGLAQVVTYATPELLLGGSGAGIGATGWRAVVDAVAITRLDLSRWPLDAARLRDLRDADHLEVLAVERCDLDDADLEILAATKSPLRELSVRGNLAVTVEGVRALAGIATLEELDVRGLPGVGPAELDEITAGAPDLRLVR